MRKKMLAANWKMNKTLAESEAFVREFIPRVADLDDVEIVICPPFTALQTVKNGLRGSNIKLGAQNVFWEEKGAYTGEVSAAMLVDSGCSHVIIGHSERRQILGETDAVINWKLKAALEAGLIPILCVGETLQERENNLALELVKDQLTRDLKDISLNNASLVIAYEPVWAIGTGVNASPDDAQEMIAFIRGYLSKLFNKETADKVRILYGGSVKEENIDQFMAEEDVDGAW
ncbi:triose-phosphate isomerase [Syntrophomonas palmitatica]|uniref:triose-phosphate isomerase n=1 Tax=Syntrophomonas palmitatica TaxID=402877 RepID=UPI000A7CC2A8